MTANELLTLREAAQMLRVCVRTIYRLIDDGDLPQPVKIRARSFLLRSAVVSYLVKQGIPENVIA
jgi:excisionase family DNA binding protein